MKIKYTRITSPSYWENVKLRIMIVTGIVFLFFFLKTLFVPGHGGYNLLFIPLCITLGYMGLKYLHEWYHYFNITAPPVIKEKGNYSVDVFTTYCNGEPLDMLEKTLIAISLIRYPHTSWCCDEANSPLVKRLCSKYGIKHITRSEKKDAKAGNINNALKYATGEICVVLDPDHIPVPEFLDVVLPYFGNEKVGFVQVVQAYYNHHESYVAKGAAQQTYQFYGPMMMCMQAYGTVQALGANCTFRRAALDSIGGHATGLAEDMHTAMRLHAKGWRSVYVPAVVARGLVPSTLSGYYKQQLKWSRGTFELLVSTYPKLFTRFTLFQKIHYFLLPFHYLSGLIFLLNFLIPVFSLLLGQSPLLLDFNDFLLAAIPLGCMIVLIRQYVQKWVVEENERGFHIVGGLLQIGTWWVYLTGLVYTVIRKKIPYLPTPKDDKEVTPFTLHIPNVIIILLSIVAIIYGLNYDWTPFSLFMASIAMINICILLFVIYASYKTRRRFETTNAIFRTKQRLWKFRHLAYKFARTYALILSALVVGVSIFVDRIYESDGLSQPAELPIQTIFYKGVFQSASESGPSQIDNMSSKEKDRLQIVSYYTTWSDSTKIISLPLEDFNKLYERQMIPLLTVKPSIHENYLFDQIVSGRYDSLIQKMANQLAKLNEPVFLCFAPESENSSRSSFFRNENPAVVFVKAWRYLHKKFEEANAKKIVWVWNPGKRDSLKKFFPGRSYVDWLGVSILDSAQNGQPNSFEDLYKPFHNDSIFQLGLPVMVTEAASLSSQRQDWWDNAWHVMTKKFPEIRSVISFNYGYDHSEASKFQQQSRSWKWNLDSEFRLAPTSTIFNPSVFKSVTLQPVNFLASVPLPPRMRAVVYEKGVHWFRNVHNASVRVLQSDIKEMRSLGVNTIFRTLPDIYSKNFFKLTRANNLDVVVKLWADIAVPQLMNDKYLKEEQERLVETVKRFKQEKNIIAWDLSNDVLYRIEGSVAKPDQLIYQAKYIWWLQQLIEKMKNTDSLHPVIVHVQWNDHADERINCYKTFIGNANQFLLDAEEKDVVALPSQLPQKFSWGISDPLLWDRIPASNMIPFWQDQQTSGFVSLNGVLDLHGRKKKAFNILVDKWVAKSANRNDVQVKILRPAKLPYKNQTLIYNALLKDSVGYWKFATDTKQQVQFEWYLVKTDVYGNAFSIKLAAKGASLSLKIPSHPKLYYLYLEAVSKDRVTTVTSSLGLPLDIDTLK